MDTSVARNAFETVHPGWHVLGVGFLAAWVWVMWLMFRISSPEAPLLTRGSLADFEVWMGAYYQNRRLGSVHARLSGQDFEQDSRLAFVVGGSRQRIRSRLTVRLDRQGSFSSFRLSMDTALLPVEIAGRLEGKYLSVSMQMGSETTRRKIKLVEAPIFDFALPRLLAAQDLSPGRRYSVVLFDPQSLGNKRTLIEVLGPEAKKTRRGLQSAIHLRRNAGGLVLDSWIDEKGNVIAEQTALGLELRREEPGDQRPEAPPVIDGDVDLSGLMHLPAELEGQRP
ncbi:MAG TPA: hypothetical protein VM425_05340 [Myxococcota bacterium]|nr:hypothetical protein [Myxococcota bacterium]